MNRFFLATNDVELTSIRYNKQRFESGKLVLEEGLPKLLLLYARLGVRGTFFVTGDMAEIYPQIPRLILEHGHEVASHSYSHTDANALDCLNLEQQTEQMLKSKRILEDAGGTEVITFRAPALRVNQFTPRALLKSGYVIDSSISPQRADMFFSFGALNKINRLWASRSPGFVNNQDLNKRGAFPIFEIPISAFILPYIGTMLRLSPGFTNLLKQFMYLETKTTGHPINFLIHPNECMIENDEDTIARRSSNYLSYLIAEKLRRNLKLRNLGEEALRLYEEQLRFFKERDYQFVSCKEYFSIWKHQSNKKETN